MYIKDIFKNNEFQITKIKYEHNSPSKDFIIKLKGKEYEIKYSLLKRLLQDFDINLDLEIACNKYPIEKLDNRPLYKKAIDIQMGKNIYLQKQKHYISINYNFLKRELEDLYEKSK